MRISLLLLALAATACTKGDDTGSDTDDTDVAANATDLRTDFPDPDWADPIVFQSGVYTIPAATEKQFCYYTTWTGPDTALHREVTYQSKFGHHFIIAGTSATEREIPDGTVIDCTEADSRGMESFEPLLVGGVIGNGNTPGLLELPDGVGAEIEQGQRLVFQSHYLNTGSEDILVQDELQFETMPIESVEHWTAPFVHTVSEFSLPTGIHSVDVKCTWDTDAKLLFVGGHMHEWGKSYKINHTHGDVTDTVYEVPVWDPYMRDAPPYEDFTAEPYQVHAGESFTTTCEWDNDTGAALGFPKEMCATFGMVLDNKVPIICDDGNATPF
jgi:hypothetical protein